MNKKNIIFLVFFIALALSPLFARADSLLESGGILPKCTAGGEGIVNLCTICDAWHLGDHIITFLLFGMAIPVITISLLWGGVLWVTARGDSGQITHGKSIMTTGLIGIVIAMSGWLVVDTILKTLASGKTWVVAWNEFPKCEIAKGSPMPTTGPTPQITPPTTPGGDYYSDSDARAVLQAAGIVVKSNLCDQNQPLPPSQCPEPRPSKSDGSACTSLDRIPKRAIDNLKKIVGIQFYVSGGTETGHTTHMPCQPVVDVVPGIPGNPDYPMLGVVLDAALQYGGVLPNTRCETQGGTGVDCGNPNANHVHIKYQ